MILRFFLILTVCFASPALSQTTSTETHYVAPIGATLTGTADGSLEHPWSSVSAAIRSGYITGGETLLLMDGDYGVLKFYNNRFDIPVVIRSLDEKAAHFEQINIGDNSGNLVFRNLSVWRNDPVSAPAGQLILSHPSSFDITIEGCDLRGGGETSNDYLSWSLEDWGYARNGIFLRGPNSIIRNNQLTGIAFGIQVFGDDSSVMGNVISGFSGDGIRAIGHRNIIRGNWIENAFDVSSNHDDGIQSWRHSGRESVEDLVIENNTIIEWAGPADHPLRSTLQGIGLFDGFFDNLVIRNNVIAVTLWHGLSVYGGRQAIIANNTVVHNDGLVEGRPWIGVFDHKNGTPSEGVLVANNLAMRMKGPSGGAVFTDNSVIFDPAAVFEDISTFNYIPTVDSGFVDTANTNYAPPLDIAGNARPIGNGPDRGAYEAGGTTTTTTGGETTTTTTTDGKPQRNGGPKWDVSPGRGKRDKQ